MQQGAPRSGEGVTCDRPELMKCTPTCKGERRGKSSPIIWRQNGAVYSSQSNTVRDIKAGPCVRGVAEPTGNAGLDRWLFKTETAYNLLDKTWSADRKSGCALAFFNTENVNSCSAAFAPLQRNPSSTANTRSAPWLLYLTRIRLLPQATLAPCSLLFPVMANVLASSLSSNIASIFSYS